MNARSLAFLTFLAFLFVALAFGFLAATEPDPEAEP